MVLDGKEPFLPQSLLLAARYVSSPPTRAPLQRTVPEYLHHTYKQPLLSLYLNEPIYEQGFQLSSDLRGDSSVVPVSTACPHSKHDDIESLPITSTWVVSLPLLAEILCRFVKVQLAQSILPRSLLILLLVPMQRV